MSRSDDELQARAAAKHSAETLGAFVELDIRKLGKSELIMLGMLKALTKYRALFEKVATGHPNPNVQHVVAQMMAPIVEDEEKMQVELTKAATRIKAATVFEIPAGSRNG